MTPSSAPDHGPKLPVVALILSLVGLCFPPLLLITGALSLYGYWRSTRDPAWVPRKQISAMTLAVSGAGLLIFVGLLLPNIKTASLRVKQLECRDTLSSLYASQLRLYAQEKRYATRLSELDWKPPRNRSIVRLAAEGPLEEFGQGLDATRFPDLSASAIDDALPKLVRGEAGLHGECPACSITMLCATELDGDAQPDVWTVSTVERSGNRGEKIPGGIAWCEVDDVTQ